MTARPKKSFGQHFLHDRQCIERIVAAIAPRDDDFLVEIGPGEGALTLPLLGAAGKLTAIELDTDLIPALRARAATVGALHVVHADVLKVDFTAMAHSHGVPRLRLAGNLPYYISSPILFHCVEHAAAIEDMHFMLQKEVVDRMAAGPGSKVYGRLSVMLQAYCTVTALFDVPPAAFRPPPKVDSAVVRLVPHAAEDIGIDDPGHFANVVRAAFGQRRKTLRNALMGVCTTEQIEAAGLRADARAEQVEVAGFVRLANGSGNGE